MIRASSEIKSATIEATIIHPDGTREPLGVIARKKKQNAFVKVFKKLFRKTGGK